MRTLIAIVLTAVTAQPLVAAQPPAVVVEVVHHYNFDVPGERTEDRLCLNPGSFILLLRPFDGKSPQPALAVYDDRGGGNVNRNNMVWNENFHGGTVGSWQPLLVLSGHCFRTTATNAEVHVYRVTLRDVAQ